MYNCVDSYVQFMTILLSFHTQQLTNNLPTLSDTMSTRDSGFEILLWWASTGLVACHWMKGEECEEHYPVIEDLPVKR